MKNRKGGEAVEERAERKGGKMGGGKMMMSENEKMFRAGMVSPKAAKKHMKSGAAPAKC